MPLWVEWFNFWWPWVGPCVVAAGTCAVVREIATWIRKERP
jgi:hypothetical protein